MLTTPPGTSDVARISARVIAICGSAASTTAVLPVTTAGAITLTRPRSVAGATIATTPVGSGAEMLKNGPATGFAPPATWAILSDQPAYQTQRSIAASSSASGTPSAVSSARRPSSISAIR